MDKNPTSLKTILVHIIDFLLKEGLTLITGAALGATIALALSYEDATAFWGMLGSLLAGLGTVGLLAFGWFASRDWIKQNTFDKTINYLLEAEELQSSIRTLSTKYLYENEKKDFDLAVRLTKKSARLSILLKAIKGFGHLSDARISTINRLTTSLDAFVNDQVFAIHHRHSGQYTSSVKKLKSDIIYPFSALGFTSQCLGELQK